MSTRTVIEVNHDYVHELEKKGHLSRELAQILISSENDVRGQLEGYLGIRFLGRRHHSEKALITVE